MKEGPFGPFYECGTCHARVGCHPGTVKPLGILADEETRKLRIACHWMFDHKGHQPAWRSCRERNRRYARLVEIMGISVRQCHFAKMDKALLKKAMEILSKEDWYEKKGDE